uniref:DUF1569 domain-containing protein n=1 Tax=Globodera pallida TaxID=36090 RepID=A0A183C5I9_GLOPA
MKRFSIQNFFSLHIFLYLFLLNLAKSNPDALTGELRLRLDNFSEFVKEPVGTERKSDEVNVRGLTWHLKASINELISAKYIKICLICTNDCKIDPNWNCYARSVQTVVALFMEEEQTFDNFKKLSDEESANMPPAAKQTVKNAEDILLDRKLTPKEQFEQIAKLDTANSFNEIAKFEKLHNITHSKALKLW